MLLNVQNRRKNIHLALMLHGTNSIILLSLDHLLRPPSSPSPLLFLCVSVSCPEMHRTLHQQGDFQAPSEQAYNLCHVLKALLDI